MTNFELDGWLLVALTIVGVAVGVAVGAAFVAPVLGGNANDTTPVDAPPYHGAAGDWTAEMEAHMIDHMGAGSVAWMDSHMGGPIDEMAQHMADDDHDTRYGGGHC